MDPERDYFEDEIDLREIARSLLRYKWLILLLPVLFGIGAYAYSRFLLPPQYDATALVVITKPSLITNLDERLQLEPAPPDINSLVGLAEADHLAVETYEALAEQGQLQAEETPVGLKGRMDASLVGTGQLQLTVTDLDPERAALIANLWAQAVVDHLNDLYGTSATVVDTLDQQIETAYDNWTQKEQELLEFLPQGQIDALTIRLENAKSSLDAYLHKDREITLIIGNAELLDARIAGKPGSSILPLEDALSLLSLYQQSVGGTEGLQLQVTAPEVLSGETTIADARRAITTLIESLVDERQEIQATAEAYQSEITSLATQLEEAQYQKNQIVVQRDLAVSAYQALSSEATETRITLTQDNQPVKMFAPAIPDDRPSGPRSVYNAAIAAAIGFALAVAFALAKEWWQAPAPLTQPREARQGL